MDIVKAKRGRKPKNTEPTTLLAAATSAAAANDSSGSSVESAEAAAVVVNEQQGSGGKKMRKNSKYVINNMCKLSDIDKAVAAGTDSSSNSGGITLAYKGMLNNSDDDTVVMKLDFKNDDENNFHSYNLQSSEFMGGNTQYSEFNQEECNFTLSNCDDSDKENNKMQTTRIVELLKDFERKTHYNEWPATTSVHCYWCCHKFTNAPFGIPVHYNNAVFHVYGCFCSLECAAAYNFVSNVGIDDVWERYALINFLGKKIGYKDVIYPAPCKLSLKIFGGHLEIEEFREYCNTGKIININFPPMMTLIQQIEEINEVDINSEFKYIPVDSSRSNIKEKPLLLGRTRKQYNVNSKVSLEKSFTII